MTDHTVFAAALCAQGIELVLRNKRLAVWPRKAFKHLTNAERQYIRDNRAELKALVQAGLPQTSVVWTPHHEVSNHEQTTPEPATPIVCEYCRQHPCIGSDHPAFAVIHGRDPAQQQASAAHQTQVMYRQIRFGHPRY